MPTPTHQWTTQFGNIYVYERLIPADICKAWMDFPRPDPTKPMQKVLVDPAKAKDIFEIIGSYMNVWPDGISEYSEDVTYSRDKKPIPEHVDMKRHNERYKLLIYLNDVGNGGTLFKKEKGAANAWISVENQQGSVVLFDMRIPHKGNPAMETKTKFTIGIRLK
jgi:hypothetical protein